MNFDNIEYLRDGNKRQRQAYSALTNHQILSKLKRFDPILVGTIPINIDIESSDLDIICCFEDKQDFIKTITDSFGNEKQITIREQQNSESLAIVANFVVDGFEIEIFGQSIPTKQQFAYRHLIIEYNLLNQYGEKFRQQIIELKQQGHKTEPAFGLALGLKGDPYTELLKFEGNFN
ncbi:MAG: hypothetical protein K0S23_290 [Fluviicola sp.]|jgi:hypothetical protein|uniref:DUF4269 domain-containing protein n=1 Tax=Fluviicola sp. TaxID=1917219 RepID=UPI002610C90F|nr:DUF4269 domain-containing protein [Fluviicola sp.]MDF3025983.1 hypothetical protein [Fluviicola sp.]